MLEKCMKEMTKIYLYNVYLIGNDLSKAAESIIINNPCAASDA